MNTNSKKIQKKFWRKNNSHNLQWSRPGIDWCRLCRSSRLPSEEEPNASIPQIGRLLPVWDRNSFKNHTNLPTSFPWRASSAIFAYRLRPHSASRNPSSCLWKRRIHFDCFRVSVNASIFQIFKGFKIAITKLDFKKFEHLTDNNFDFLPNIIQLQIVLVNPKTAYLKYLNAAFCSFTTWS